jgi:trimethylamine:corrinoid methyltransferase-like protein
VARRIVAQAYDVLCRIGVEFHDRDARAARRSTEPASISLTAARISRRHSWATLSNAPRCVRLHDAHGVLTHDIGDDRLYFVPGSSAMHIVDHRRNAAAADSGLRGYVKVVSGLTHLEAQSTAFVPSDVHPRISDSYRLFLSLLYGEKPVVTGHSRRTVLR